MIKRSLLLLLALLMLFIAAACNNEEPEPDPANTAVPNPTETAEPDPTDTAEPEVDPTNTPEPEVEATEEPEQEPTQEADLPGERATIINDEGGPIAITGVVTYTSPFFTLGVSQPVVILEDQAGFVDRDEQYIFPLESQALGQITSDFLTSPFSYSLSLPIEPRGGYRDVDNDGEEDQGVQVFAVAYWTNTYGDPFLEERDLGGGGWSGAYASTRISTDLELENEIVGGTFVVFAPDDQQGFPSGFGEDNKLFTEDDPIVTLPQGYTLVNIDQEPFTFDRTRLPVVDLIEPEFVALVDYSEESYTDAFNNLVDKLANEYAFTAYKEIDWEALRAEFLPQFEEADANSDADLYRRALRDFAWRIPDGHVSGPFLGDEFRNNVLGGIGLALRELDDGRALVTFVVENSPAFEAGIEERAEITEMNGVPITEHIDNTTPWGAPFSTPHAERLEKQQFATRFPLGTEVEITYINPDSSAPQTATLTATSELESYFYWFEDDDRDGFELPVEYELLEEGIGYVQIFSFSDNNNLAVQLWERMLQAMKEQDVPAIIIDMRTNGGGSGSVADNLSAYFFDEVFPLGNASYYDEERGEFYSDPETVDEFILPPEEYRYNGDVVILVGPSCASACEFFSYNFTITDRGTIIGHYPTAGLGGSVDEVAMPEDETFRFTQGRAVGPDGEIHIEGIGVVPDLRVPLTEETLFDQEDAVLQAAVSFLAGETVEMGGLLVGDTAVATIQPGQKIQYELNVLAGEIFDILLESNSAGVNLILTVYDINGNVLAETDPGTSPGFVDIDLGEDIVLILEVTTESGDEMAEFTLQVPESE